jgi:hypothetical protein
VSAWRRLAPLPTQIAAGLIVVLLSLQIAGYLAGLSRTRSTLEVVAAALGGVIAVAVGLRVVRMSGLGAIVSTVLLLWTVLNWDTNSYVGWPDDLARWSVPSSLALAGAVAVVEVFSSQGTRLSPAQGGMLLGAFLLSAVATQGLLYGEADVSSFYDEFLHNQFLFVVSDVLLIAALIVARRNGSTFQVYFPGTVRSILLPGFAIFLALPAIGFSQYVGVCALAVLLALTFAVPKSRSERAVHLSSGTADQRRGLLIELAKQRVLQDNAKSTYRDAVASLAAPEAQLAPSAEIESKAHAAVEVLTTRLDGAVVERAFAAPPGTTPWRSGVLAALVAAILSVPFLWFALRGQWIDWWAAFRYYPVLFAAPFRLGEIRSVFFGFIYGYFYPQLRGVTALGKSVRFWASILPADLLCTWLSQRTGGTLTKALTVEAAQQAMILMVLGAVWEFRAMRSVRLPWSVLRSFRGLQTVSGPVSAVLVAAVTAAVTTFVTTYAKVQVSPHNPKPAVTSSSPVAGGRGS